MKHDPPLVGSRTWHRGPHCNFYPDMERLRAPGGPWEYFLKGWVPQRPYLDAQVAVLAIGSCFAQEIVRYLDRRPERKCPTADETFRQTALFWHGSGFVNTYSLRQQIEWALGLRQIDRGFLAAPEPKVSRKGEREVRSYTHLPVDEAARLATEAVIRRTEVFIFTLGLAEVWEDQVAGEVFFKAVPEECFDGRRHRFRVTTIEENQKNLDATYRAIRQVRPEATIIWTLSPVPLIATFRPQACVPASEVSKSILRVAVDEHLRSRADDRRLFYWPSYELVRCYFPAVGEHPFEPDLRHVRRPIVARIMDLWWRVFVQ